MILLEALQGRGKVEWKNLWTFTLTWPHQVSVEMCLHSKDRRILFNLNKSLLAVVHISRAPFGLLDASRVVDVTLEVQSMVEGRKLHFGTDVDLTKAFSKDPCPGMRKKLRVSYVTRGFIGAVRVRERNDLFVTTIELGYPAVAGEDS